ncbi:pitrilysin family protein [Streptomyces sp. NPDC047130]|uniref:M16 family metallopeptidase n=1 Tax=Streptomyces sp. NPDC047130 TaxID=3155261 RepID=UPI0033CD951F
MDRKDAPHGALVTARLANGLTVVAQRDALLRDPHVHLRHDVGSRHERPGEHGLAHFLEHLMFRGTPRHPDFLGTLRRAGARDVNASTNQDRTAFTMTVPREELRRSLAMEADRTAHLPLALDRTALAETLAVVRREEEERGGPSGRAAALLFAEAFPPGHPYRHPSMGDTDLLGRLLPEQVAGFHRSHYRPDGATLVVLGDVSPQAVTDAAAATLGALPRHPAPPDPPAPDRFGRRPGGVVHGPARPRGAPPQVHVMAHTPPYGTDEHAAFAALAAVLGKGRGSRLFRDAVRGRGVAVPATEMVTAWELERGGSVLFGTVTATAGTSGERLLAEVRSVLASVSDGLTPGELDRAVRLLRRERYEALDDPTTRAEAFAAHVRLRGCPAHAYTAADALASVTENDVVRAAGLCLPGATFLVQEPVGMREAVVMA